MTSLGRDHVISCSSKQVFPLLQATHCMETHCSGLKIIELKLLSICQRNHLESTWWGGNVLMQVFQECSTKLIVQNLSCTLVKVNGKMYITLQKLASLSSFKRAFILTNVAHVQLFNDHFHLKKSTEVAS